MIRTRSPLYLASMLALGVFMSSCGGSDSASMTTFPTTPLINPNSASQAELSSVPGLSDEMAERIVADRPYATPGALHAVIGQGVDEQTQQQIYGVLFVKVGLNTGAESDYKLIPSTLSPGKLAHEFEEYRPYESIDQFKREMAKYVSDAEVDHLARYVTLE